MRALENVISETSHAHYIQYRHFLSRDIMGNFLYFVMRFCQEIFHFLFYIISCKNFIPFVQ